MPEKKQIEPGEKAPLKLTALERKLVLEDVTALDLDYERVLRETPSGNPVMMTLDELDDFAGYIAAEANHSRDSKLQKQLDAVVRKIEKVLDSYTDKDPPQTLKIEEARNGAVISEQAVEIAQFAAQALEAARELRIKTKLLEDTWLSPGQRDVLLLVPTVSKTVKN